MSSKDPRAEIRRDMFRIGIACASVFALAAGGTSGPSASAQTPLAGAAGAADPDARARAIVAQMTLDEKIAELHGIHTQSEGRTVPGIARLGIPPMNVTNGPAGVGNGGPGHDGNATALPAPIALAAAWDVDAANDYGRVAGSESIALANALLEAPTVNIARVPQNGRTFEGFGEDPYLAGRIAVANILGIQGTGAIANVKHFAGNNQETHRTSISDDVDERTLREIYLPAFEAAIKEGHCGSLMGAYNKVNGTFSCENDLLLNQILKKEWGFDGFVTSDFGAVHSTVGCALGGLDLEMPTGKFFGDALKTAVQNNTVPISVIDEKLIRRFRTMMRLGVWDNPPLVMKPIPVEANGEKARQLSEESMVLLKNESDLLPLDPAKLKTIAVIGPFADHAMTGGGGSSHVKAAYTVAPVEGIQKRVGAKLTVTYDAGMDPTAAAAVAKASDVAIVMLGDRQSEGHDHPLTLSADQDALVEAVLSANPRTIVVLKSGGPVLMPWANKAPAILEAWYPGEEDGTAVAAVLFGDFDPSGKLPITFPRDLADLPANTPAQYPGENGVAHYSEGVLVGYRWYDARRIEPLFPFGFGLSYTRFQYRNTAVSSKQIAAGPLANQTVAIDFDVVNVGKRAGAEVAQVYVGVRAPEGMPQPPQQLKSFRRVALEAGRSAHVHLILDARAFAYWNTRSHGWEIAAGDYPIYVGSSSRDIRLKESVRAR